MLGYVPFPPITEQPYPLTLTPYSFFWLELQPAPEAPPPPAVTSDAEAKIAMQAIDAPNEMLSDSSIT